MRTMDVQSGKGSMGRIIVMSLQSTARCTSPSFIAAARSSTCRDCHQRALAQLGVFVCRSVLFNVAGDLAYIYRLVAI